MKVNIGKGLELDVDVSRMNAEVLSHITYIGLRNILMDSHAGVTLEKCNGSREIMRHESELTALRKLDAMYAGEIRKVREGSGESRDPVTSEARSQATKVFHSIISRKWEIKNRDAWAGQLKPWLDQQQLPFGTEDEREAAKEAFVKALSETPAYREAAEKVVAARAGAKKVDLASLGL